MERLYCPECGDYLEGGDGSMVDCHCGWRQERSIESDEEELETLRQRVAELESQMAEVRRAEREKVIEKCIELGAIERDGVFADEIRAKE